MQEFAVNNKNPIAMINILIASDHQSSRKTLTDLLSAQPAFRIIAICADTHAAICIAAREQPDIVFIDGSSDPLAAIEATKKITNCSTAGVIALSGGIDADFAQHMIAAGALGYVTHRSSTAEIISAVIEVAKDNLFNCYGGAEFTLPTPERASFKQSLTSLGRDYRKKITDTVHSHWHGILNFTN